MKAYIATTGLLFLALVAAHVLRLVPEPHLARDPWFLLTTFISLGMASWAFMLFRSTLRSQTPAA
jgi:hypothetical protein